MSEPVALWVALVAALAAHDRRDSPATLARIADRIVGELAGHPRMQPAGGRTAQWAAGRAAQLADRARLLGLRAGENPVIDELCATVHALASLVEYMAENRPSGAGV